MLNVKCPNCSATIKLSNPKTGKFSPTCKYCDAPFRLSIRQLTDGSFQHKVSVKQNNAAPNPANENEDLQAEARIQPSKESRNETDTHGRKIKRLGPYRLIKKLGEGGMGAVYLANQTSLDRFVALKVIKSRLSDHPSVMARFTREAYAAAQLIHPNVVQIYDMGEENGKSYFSMEFVDGQSLRQLVADDTIEPELAAGYILQAARGLQCAHQAGMVHRDIKPGNLLINHQGLIKVADLGLVKVPDQDEIEGPNAQQIIGPSVSQDLTRFGATIGTPSYMAPEQAQSGSVDHRADIYSLGCTFYVLLTGKRPFKGKTADEIASKHLSAPLVEPHRVCGNVPEELSAIVAKMMAKRPDDRYQTMGDLIEQLEKFLGLKTAGISTLSEDDAVAIEKAGIAFNDVPLASARGFVPAAMIAVSIIFAMLTSWFSWKLAGSFLMLPLFAIAAYFFTSGVLHTSVLFDKTRELVAHASALDWVKWILAGLVLLAASYLLGALPYLIFVAVLSTGLGVGYLVLVDVPIASARQPFIETAHRLIRRWRVRGIDETTIQTFVAKYAPPAWEEFFEHLFGYSAKRKTRNMLTKSDAAATKPKFRAWRDRIYDRLDISLKTLANDDDREHLRNVEQAGLINAGMSADEALSQASQIADALVDQGDSLRIAQLEKRLAKADPLFEREKIRASIKRNLADARSGKYKRKQTPAEILEPKLDRGLGAFPRFLLGCLLVFGSTIWAHQNDLLLSSQQLQELGQQGIEVVADQNDKPHHEAANEVVASIKQQGQEFFNAAAVKPTRSWLFVFYSFDSLLAGLLLIASAIIGGWRMSMFVLPAVLIAMFGSAFGIPDFLPVAVPNFNKTTALAAIVLLGMGIVFGRRED